MTLAPAIVASPELQPMTGYDLKDVFDMSVGHFWTTTQSHIYEALTDLEKEVWVEKKIVQQQDKPNREKYSITKTIRAELRRGMTAPSIGTRSVEELETNLGSTGWALEAELMVRLKQINQPKLPSPFGFITTARR